MCVSSAAKFAYSLGRVVMICPAMLPRSGVDSALLSIVVVGKLEDRLCELRFCGITGMSSCSVCDT